jgi:hypothetical protein
VWWFCFLSFDRDGVKLMMKYDGGGEEAWQKSVINDGITWCVDNRINLGMNTFFWCIRK